jgi:hypothetical protein
VQNGSDSEGLLNEILEQYEHDYSGTGRTLEDALEDAYEKAKGSGKHVFHVEHVFVTGDNPLSGYAVVLHPHG